MIKRSCKQHTSFDFGKSNNHSPMADSLRIGCFCTGVFVLLITWQGGYGSRWPQDGVEQEDLALKSEELNTQSKRQFFQNDFDDETYKDEVTSSFWEQILPRKVDLRNQEAKCDLTRVRELSQASICMPRPTVVAIPFQHLAVSAIVPYHVILNQCGGGNIVGHWKCIPEKIKMVDFPIMKITPNGRNYNCDTVTLEEHLTCTHGCSLKLSDCNENQKFSQAECKCVCADRSQAFKCDPEKQMWIEASCSCECLPSVIHECSTGFEFNDDLCKCTRKSYRRSLNRRFLPSLKHPIVSL